ncbi:MAG: kinase [Pseudomonadota bacterium]
MDLVARLRKAAAGPRVAAAIEAEGLPAAYREQLDHVAVPLAAQLARLTESTAAPPIVGINGSQGSGKTTVAVFLALLLEEAAGLHAVELSIDDFYLTRNERARLADDVHPLLATRGVPGTHDLILGRQIFDALVDRRSDVALPRFEKAEDDRASESTWRVTDRPADLVLFEGWCVACPPQQADALEAPVNALERDEDADGVWRGFVNDQLAGPYREWFGRIDALVMLRVPSFDQVKGWRLEQERKLIARRQAAGLDISQTMDEAGVERFIAHYERLTRHMLDTLPAEADGVITVDQRHHMTAIDGLL